MRRQITLFVPSPIANRIEAVRRQFNPVQAKLIAAHVTLCRDDEVQEWELLQARVQNMASRGEQLAIRLQFGAPHQEGNGVYLPVVNGADQFHQLRQQILEDLDCRIQTPHITLVHPRNGECTAADFKVIRRTCDELDLSIVFSQITLIQMIDNEPWKAIQSVSI